jgi:hypothetical protein
MLYTSGDQDFEHQVHPALKRRIRIFLIISAIMTAIVLYDIVDGKLSVALALASVIVGAAVGLFTSRIFHLSWEKDGSNVVGTIDTVGWVVLVLYIAFEVARSYFFASVIHLASSATAITFAFVASALAARVLGLRGRILTVLKEEKVFGR